VVAIPSPPVATGTIDIDERHWPLVIITFDGAASGEPFQRYLAGMSQLLARRQPHGYLLDGRQGAMMGPTERALQGEWLKKNKVELKQYSRATALVLRSAAVRFVLSAIYLIQSPVVPTETFGTVDEAHAWLGERFSAEGLRLPPRDRLTI
jgi:hypothetical protein